MSYWVQFCSHTQQLINVEDRGGLCIAKHRDTVIEQSLSQMEQSWLSSFETVSNYVIILSTISL